MSQGRDHPDSDRPESVTALLEQLSEGNRDIEDKLIPLIYDGLHRIAVKYMRTERPNHTLQPTALVNEAYQRLVQRPKMPWKCRAQFFATASKLMRHILVDHARARKAEKRGGALEQVTLDEESLPSEEKTLDILVLNELLQRLAEFDERQARILELHLFGGLTFEEIAEILHVSERTVQRDWTMACAWVKGELSKNQ
jgi:RNA polymerase sigma factor (TIGR02999 family)